MLLPLFLAYKCQVLLKSSFSFFAFTDTQYKPMQDGRCSEIYWQSRRKIKGLLPTPGFLALSFSMVPSPQNVVPWCNNDR